MILERYFKWPTIVFFFKTVLCSVGDKSPFYINCVENCNSKICQTGNHATLSHGLMGYSYSLWSCSENCEYDCQWKTVESFQKKKWSIPQFKGKWPFIRILGFQEPASVFFSLLNFIVVLKLLILFRAKVPKSTQYYYVWNIFGLVQLNSWFWSSVYHSKDTDFTEKMDYMSAFLLITYFFYSMGLRFMSSSVNLKTILWSIVCGTFCINHLTYLWLFNFDYGYNMKLSCLIGGATVIGWFLWTFLHFQSQPFVWKVFLFGVLVIATAFLELMDFPPIFWLVDAHALWHGSTIIVNLVFFLFIIDDCQHLDYVQFTNESPMAKDK